ncbi:Trm112 family protein [Granulicella sp. dw_53]|uniref:Trm112 family protein n=1 Tax=Granulicella sp. dw_53 TaxID=2719792 RepID=UPI001BD352C8|nr:Trm112 family protein [Granulicella sp. dw_53]
MQPNPGLPVRRLTQQDLLHLACPVCHASLQLEGSAILCTGCSRRYPVVDGLPVLLSGSAH